MKHSIVQWYNTEVKFLLEVNYLEGKQTITLSLT